MIDLTVTRNINADIDEVWAVLAHFGDLSWVPGSHRVEAIGSGVGMTRRIHMPGMPPIDEKLLSLDNAAHTLSYEIPPHEVIPFTDYLADIRVSEDGDTTRVEWHCCFNECAMPPAHAREAIEQNLNMLLDSLDAIFNPSSCCGGCCG